MMLWSKESEVVRKGEKDAGSLLQLRSEVTSLGLESGDGVGSKTSAQPLDHTPTNDKTHTMRTRATKRDTPPERHIEVPA